MNLRIVVTLYREPEESNLAFRARTVTAMAEINRHASDFGLSISDPLIRADAKLNPSIRWTSSFGDAPLPDDTCNICTTSGGNGHQLVLDPGKVEKTKLRIQNLAIVRQPEFQFDEAAPRL